MKKNFSSKLSKITVDILIVLIFTFTIAFADVMALRFRGWNSLHCLFGLILLLLIVLHIMQHWVLVKALAKKRVSANNKITAGIVLIFCLTFLSVCFFILGFNMPFLKYHNVMGHFFALGIVVHIVHKFKRFLALFRSKIFPS